MLIDKISIFQSHFDAFYCYSELLPPRLDNVIAEMRCIVKPQRERNLFFRSLLLKLSQKIKILFAGFPLVFYDF